MQISARMCGICQVSAIHEHSFSELNQLPVPASVPSFHPSD
jgi:hypothetical protein